MPHKTPLQYVHEQSLTSALRMVYLVSDKYTTVAEQTDTVGLLFTLIGGATSTFWVGNPIYGNIPVTSEIGTRAASSPFTPTDRFIFYSNGGSCNS